MRVLHIEGAVDGVGGSFFSLDSLVRGLDPNDYQSTVVFARSNLVADAMMADGISIHLLDEKFPRPVTGSRIRFHWELARASIRSAREIRMLESLAGAPFSVVHTNDQLETNVGWILGAALLGRPVVAHERQEGTFRWAHRVLSRLISAHVRVSHYIDDHCKRSGLSPRRSTVIHNGIDPTEPHERGKLATQGRRALAELGIPPDASVVLAPGTVAPWKGTEDIVQAFSILNNSTAHLVVAGSESSEDRGYGDRIRAAAAKRDLESRIHFVGFRRDVRALMAASAVVVHAARRPEPFGRVPLEAMELGRPVVVTDAGGVREVVPADVGWRVEPGNAAAIAAAVGRILNGVSTRERLDRGTALARENFAPGSYVDAMARTFVTASRLGVACES